jgi:hypothetical protein
MGVALSSFFYAFKHYQTHWAVAPSSNWWKLLGPPTDVETPTVVGGITNYGVTFNPEFSKNSGETHTYVVY